MILNLVISSPHDCLHMCTAPVSIHTYMHIHMREKGRDGERENFCVFLTIFPDALLSTKNYLWFILCLNENDHDFLL